MRHDPAFLAAVVDTLLPADDGLPSGTAAGVTDRLAEHLRAHPERATLARLLDGIAAAHGGDARFVALDDAARAAVLEAVERETGDAFRCLLVLVLADYCEAEPLLAALGWRAGPPQPRGFELAPFDEACVERAKRRPRLWR
jgi:gluconate 2-dehydrogenase subunit 3-like protein